MDIFEYSDGLQNLKNSWNNENFNDKTTIKQVQNNDQSL